MKTLVFPELRQTYQWDCGAKSVQSVLGYYGIDVREDLIIKLAGTTREGTSISGLKKVIKKYGLKFKAEKMTLTDIKRYLDKKIPVILLLQAWSDKEDINWEEDWIDGHYVVAIGYDSKNIYFEDPSALCRTYLNYQEFEKRWHDIDKNGKKYLNWGMTIFSHKKNALKKLLHMD